LGYGALIDRWERTGGWTQQWTTLRNLADLLDRLGDHTTGARLRDAADAAPEAAAVTLRPTSGSSPTKQDTTMDHQRVLADARAAITRALLRVRSATFAVPPEHEAPGPLKAPAG
jgi:hypothetical protein